MIESEEWGLIIGAFAEFFMGVMMVEKSSGIANFLFIVGALTLILAIVRAVKKENGTYPTMDQQRENEQKEIERERQSAIASQNRAPWERYYTFACPYCGHYKVRPANWDDKKMSVAFWGAASSKLGDHYKCEHCKKTWK